ncbi:MAG: phage-like protein exported protein [Comamonadaceae bacterium]|nr:MAG: phage-like protein exported protein [Comamonadaceae bacterium]
MIVEFNLANLIFILIAVVSAFWALIKIINIQQDRRQDERFKALGEMMKAIAATQEKNALATLELEREFRRHQTDSAREYVRRDDFVRHVGTLEARIDNFALRMERALDNLGAKP